MQSGKLRHKSRIETPTVSRDTDYGDVTETWATLGNGEVWANIRPISGVERWQANAVDPAVTHKITIRYHGTVRPKDRIVYNSRYFRILSVLDIDERNETTAITAVEEI